MPGETALVLLISPEKTLLDPLQKIWSLPSIRIVQMATVAEVRSQLKKHPSLILLHSGQAADYRAVKHMVEAPIIALLEQPEDRSTVLKAGADDYLLLPLTPAEVSLRLNGYFRSPLCILDEISPVINHLKRGDIRPDIWADGLDTLAKLFAAGAAWLFRFDKPAIISYNLPAPLRRHRERLAREIRAFFQPLPETRAELQLVIKGPYPAWLETNVLEGLVYQAYVPIYSGQKLLGTFTLAYNQPPLFSHAEEAALLNLGHCLGSLLEMHHIQKETQEYATKNAFMLLIARTVSEQLEINTILSTTLEHVIPLLNASGGEIWLVSANQQWLELASALASPFAKIPQARRGKEAGLIGWPLKAGEILQTCDPLNDPHFDPAVDQPIKTADPMLVVPLRHRGHSIGALAIYGHPDLRFTSQDIVLIEGIASLTASAIANARLLQELRENADQRKVLYEMSQQIAAGLNLEATINRILHWVSRMFNAEISLLWLRKQEKPEQLFLAAAQGIRLPEKEPTGQAGDDSMINWVIRSGETVVINDLNAELPFALNIPAMLKLVPRNIMAVPLAYYGESIGVLSLVNKNDGPFNETDLTLLSTASEMIAVAVGNARLHTQTVNLMQERERLHQQVLQSERLATVGRLTATLSHEINNPMQAIQGALTLALEEIDSVESVQTYLDICMSESNRVVQLLARLRQIYRPQVDESESIDLNHLLQEAIKLAHKEIKRHKIKLQINLAPDLPHLTAVAGQLHLVFLSLLLNLSDAIGARAKQNGRLSIRTRTHADRVRIEFITDHTVIPIADWLAAFQPTPVGREADFSFGLSLSQDIVTAHGGRIKLNRQGDKTICRVELPVDG